MATTEASTESYWQQGCTRARAGLAPILPFPMASGYEQNYSNTGYMNGWKYGKLAVRLENLAHAPLEDEGSRAD
jgi:hypothetical protein